MNPLTFGEIHHKQQQGATCMRLNLKLEESFQHNCCHNNIKDLNSRVKDIIYRSHHTFCVASHCLTVIDCDLLGTILLSVFLRPLKHNYDDEDYVSKASEKSFFAHSKTTFSSSSRKRREKINFSPPSDWEGNVKSFCDVVKRLKICKI